LIGNFFAAKITGKRTKFVIKNINDTVNENEQTDTKVYNKIFEITCETKIVIQLETKINQNEENIENNILETKNTLNFDSIGGLSSQINQIIELTNSLHQSSVFIKFGLKPPKGILLFGPPGKIILIFIFLNFFKFFFFLLFKHFLIFSAF
jgi:ATP-dependent 26S proteasome regulatory subunit